jgi:hypothetical protein
LFLLILVSLVSAIATAQTTPSDLCSVVPTNCVTGDQVPDLVAARMVIHSFSLPSNPPMTDIQSRQSLIGAVVGLTADDATIVEQAIDAGLSGNFQDAYVSICTASQNGTISSTSYKQQRDALVTSIQNNVHAQISADGWSKLSAFVTAQKQFIFTVLE